jgi:hypothetical protein
VSPALLPARALLVLALAVVTATSALAAQQPGAAAAQGGGRGAAAERGDRYAPDGGLIIDRGGNVLGATGNDVEPFAIPKPNAATVAKPARIAGAPNLSGYYFHGLRPWENPPPSMGVTPGAYGEPSPVTVLTEESNARAAQRGDYRSPLLRPWAAALIKAQGDANAASRPFQNPSTGLCRPGGILGTWGRPNKLQIVQTADKVVLLFKGYAFRTISLNAKHPAKPPASVYGHSVGHWEGETLVVDTVGFDGSAALDRFGTPATEQMHLVERIGLRHDGQVLEVNFWVDDPIVFTQPWTSVVTYARSDGVDPEAVCQEGLMFNHPF